MRMLKCGKVPKLELNKLWANMVKAEVETLTEIIPVINNVLIKNVGTRYYSLKQLKSMGHPYRDRAPGGLAPGVINVQSGEFFQSFRLVGPTIQGNKVTIFVENDSWKAKMLLNPKRMIPRPWESYLMWHLQRAITPKLGSIFAAKFKFKY